MAQKPEMTCHICENTNGKYFCYDCHIILCDKCKKDHYKYPANKNHTIKESHSKVLPVKYECEQHHKDYLHYCQNCECLICSECITLEHNGHVFKGIKEIADNARKTVSDAICKLKTKQLISTSAKEVITSSKISKIENDTDKFISEVHCLSKSLKEIVEEVVKTDATYAEDFLHLEKTKLECFLETLNESVGARSSIINKLENILLETHDVTFYFHQAKILNEFLGSESDDIPTLEENKDLQQFESEDFIDKVLEKIQIKHGIRSIQRKEIQEKQLSERLKQEEISHKQTKEEMIKESQRFKEAIQSKDMQVENISKRLRQEEISHNKMKEATIAERKKLKTCLTIALFGQCGAGKSATGNTLLGKEVFDSNPSLEPVTEFIEKSVLIFASQKIDIFDTPGSMSKGQCTKTLKKIYKRTERQKSNVIFVYIFAPHRATREILDLFECFHTSCIEKNQKFIIVFTCHAQILEGLDSSSIEGNEECNQWLKTRFPSVASAIQQNGSRCVFIENKCSWESRQKYQQEILSICGINCE